MSPEQLAGDEVGPESDVYSLGLLAFELLTGEGPFPGQTPRALMISHLREDPPLLSSIRGDVDPELDSLVAQCLSKVPGERPASDRIALLLAPGADTRLEWPPPGLDSLMGMGRRVGMWALVAMGLSSLPTVIALVYPLPELAAFRARGAPAVVAFIVLIGPVAGSVFVALAGTWAVEAGLVWRRGLALGYGWLTLAEVAADHRGDTGALTTGGKEYLTLPPSVRRRLRILRLLAVAAPFAAVLALVVSYPLAVILSGSGGTSGPVLFSLLYGPAIALVLLGASAEAPEAHEVGKMRRQLRRRRSPSRSIGRLVGSWYTSLEETTEGTPLGSGPQGRDWLSWVAVAGILLTLLGGLLIAVPVGTMSVVGPLVAEDMRPRFSGIRFEQLEIGRPYRLRTDPSIDASAAAVLLDSLRRIPPEAGDSTWRNRPSAALIAGSPLVSGGPLGSCRAGQESCDRDLIHPDSALIAASRGLSDTERRYLSTFGHSPLFPVFSTLARASGLDELRALELELGGPLITEGMTWLSVRRFRSMFYPALREIAYWKIGYAAWQYAEGDYAGAEETLRELISFGLLWMDDGSTRIGALIGAAIGDMGVDNLRLFYTLTGRLQEAASLETTSTPDADVELATEPSLRTSSLEEQLRDPEVPRQLKIQLVLPFLYGESCTSPRGLLSGPRESALELVQGPVREEIVRSPLESQVYDLILDWESNIWQEAQFLGGWGALARGAALLTGNRRLASCVVLAGAYF
jgi:hypothetical protein